MIANNIMLQKINWANIIEFAKMKKGIICFKFTFTNKKRFIFDFVQKYQKLLIIG